MSKGVLVSELNDVINRLVDISIALEFGSWESFEEYAEREYGISAGWDVEGVLDIIKTGKGEVMDE